MRKVIKTCKYCGKEFECDKRSTGEFCSQLCKSYFNGTRIKYNCEYCGKESSDKASHYNRKKNHFCSDDCKAKWQSENVKGENHPNYNGGVKCDCDYCGKEIVVIKSIYSKNNHNYCSKECRDNYLNENNKIKCNCDYCGKEIVIRKSQYNKSKNHYCSFDCANKGHGENIKGENNPLYNPNKTQEEREQERSYPEYNDWRKEVYERDNYTCQCCGKRGNGEINAHHIYGYAEYKDLRIDIDNGVTLCEDCHKEYHKQYGYTNNNYKDFHSFLYNEMLEQGSLEARLFYINTMEDITLRLEIRGLLELESA